MDKSYPHCLHQQSCDYFNLLSENYVNKGSQESSSSSANILVSTELSLSFTISFSAPSSTKTIMSNRERRNSSSSSSSKPCYSYSTTKTYHRESNSITNSSSYGCSSTALKLYDDPWKIKKVLKASDLGKLNRLLLSSDSMEDLIVSVLGNKKNNNNEEEEEELLMKGRAVRVWDVETKSLHQLILKRWASFKNFVLIGKWNQDFVRRRNLKRGDEIGLQWDPYNLCFNFSILKRSVMEKV